MLSAGWREVRIPRKSGMTSSSILDYISFNLKKQIKDINMAIEYIPYVDACNFPPEVDDYCCHNEINTHYQNEVVHIPNDDNPFALWLKEQGVEIKSTGITVAIMAT